MDTVIDKKVTVARLAVARDIISAWCRLRNKKVEDIPALAEDRATEVDVALLAYAIKAYTNVDVVAVGKEMGITGGLVLSLRKHTHNKVMGQTALNKKLGTLLVEAGLRAVPIKVPRPKPDPSPDSKPPKPPRKRREDHAQRRAEHDALLQSEGEEVIKKILAQFHNAGRDRVFSTFRLPHLADIRIVSYAVLYHTVLEKNDYGAIARYFGKSTQSVSHSIDRVSDEINSGRSSPLKEKIVRVCTALDITPDQLTH